MDCIFIYGPAASGKLTIANALRARLGLPVFHNHLAVDTALTLFEFGSPPFVRLRESIWLAAFRDAAEAGRSFIFTFTPEATVPSTFIGAAVSAIERAGGRVVFVSITCSDAVIEERIERDSRRKFGKLTSLDEYRRLRDVGAFTYTALPEAQLSIASDVLAPEDAAQKIVELLKI